MVSAAAGVRVVRRMFRHVKNPLVATLRSLVDEQRS